jgi:hypothetical protein
MSLNHHQDIIASIYFTKLIYGIIMISLLWMVQVSRLLCPAFYQDSSKYHTIAKFITYHHKSHQDSKFITVSIINSKSPSIQNHKCAILRVGRTTSCKNAEVCDCFWTFPRTIRFHEKILRH